MVDEGEEDENEFLNFLDDQSDDDDDYAEFGGIGIQDFSQEAAHNLARLYIQSGSHELARRLYNEHIVY